MTTSEFEQMLSGNSGRIRAIAKRYGANGEVDASILMMYLDGLTGQEMASVLGIKINNVQVRINRMRKVFAERYLEAE